MKPFRCVVCRRLMPKGRFSIFATCSEKCNADRRLLLQKKDHSNEYLTNDPDLKNQLRNFCFNCSRIRTTEPHVSRGVFLCSIECKKARNLFLRNYKYKTFTPEQKEAYLERKHPKGLVTRICRREDCKEPFVISKRSRFFCSEDCRKIVKTRRSNEMNKLAAKEGKEAILTLKHLKESLLEET